jgi:hypothetical protein
VEHRLDFARRVQEDLNSACTATANSNTAAAVRLEKITAAARTELHHKVTAAAKTERLLRTVENTAVAAE